MFSDFSRAIYLAHSEIQLYDRTYSPTHREPSSLLLYIYAWYIERTRESVVHAAQYTYVYIYIYT